MKGSCPGQTRRHRAGMVLGFAEQRSRSQGSANCLIVGSVGQMDRTASEVGQMLPTGCLADHIWRTGCRVDLIGIPGSAWPGIQAGLRAIGVE